MELASLLAGERFSDHPKSVHPVLAAIARSVNDCTTDDGRPALAPLAAAVIGTATDDDPRVGPELVRLCSRRALERREIRGRFVVTVALLAAQHQLDRLDGRPPTPAAEVLAPHVTAKEARDTEQFVRGVRTSARYYRRRGAQEAAVCAVLALASEPGPSTDVALRELLADAVTWCRSRVAPAAGAPTPDRHDGDPAGDVPLTTVPVDEEEWSRACALVGSRRTS